jgi:hypothetical protein
MEHVNGRNLLSDFQSGFRRGHSTATALVRVTEDLRSAKVGGKVTVHVLLDLSKTFVHKFDSRYDFHTSGITVWFHRFFGIVLRSLRLMG